MIVCFAFDWKSMIIRAVIAVFPLPGSAHMIDISQWGEAKIENYR